ncbi:uncharacterized protein LOC119691784 [Plutella xylostella]|uniref:uncharacterized protein LOC119691784 n=1 Tax=Plutella xylostella TaxID=51655 RepID=UPI0020327E78|nr:uncharacterized protein LOC119691784 [Plutella xylostella]
MLLCQMCGTIAETSTYTLRNIDPGIYVEQIGTATINRGTFRIETSYQRESMKMDHEKVTNVVTQFENLCKNVKTVIHETHCEDFYHHIVQEESKFHKIIQYLTEIEHTRRKRGLLGRFLTSVFGVNDEVYKDIDTLQDNQKQLIEASNHQTKFMISTIVAVNQTEERIQNKLQRFQNKLNQAIEFINNNNVWYKTIDENHIKIQVMQTYQLATNYISEIMDSYSGLLEIYLDNASVYNILTPKSIKEIITTANSKLPANLKIVQANLLNTRMIQNTTHIQVYAYYPIHDISKYTLVHVTSVPKINEDNTFQSINIQEPFMGFDYNNERYFELNYQEYKNCLRKGQTFICYPVAVKNMQSNKNCIVDQLFKKSNNQTQCTIRTNNITSDILWKQLYIPNTWLFVTKKIVTASVICDGQREELSIHDVKRWIQTRRLGQPGVLPEAPVHSIPKLHRPTMTPPAKPPRQRQESTIELYQLGSTSSEAPECSDEP